MVFRGLGCNGIIWFLGPMKGVAPSHPLHSRRLWTVTLIRSFEVESTTV